MYSYCKLTFIVGYTWYKKRQFFLKFFFTKTQSPTPYEETVFHKFMVNILPIQLHASEPGL